MTLTQLRTMLKGMSEEQKNTFLLEYYKRLSKQDKEMFALLLELTKDNKPLPDKKAKIIDLKAAEKKYPAFVDGLFNYPYRSPNAQRKIKKQVKSFVDELPLMPPEAEGYEEALLFYKKVIALICLAAEDLGTYPAYFFRILGLSMVKCFDTLISMTLARKTTPDLLEDLVHFAGLTEIAEEDYEGIEILDHIANRIKNGDLRMEMLEHCESALTKESEVVELEAACPEQKSTRQAYSKFYLLLSEREGALEDACSFLKNTFGVQQANETISLYQKDMGKLRQVENQRIAQAMTTGN
ncbi:hypothetical protein [Allobaculum sp. JKK-2023]|uniref:hypothetical protein n=1 Tax=Allobaculum sp. JKK-2023 TaxID=3108943 RepID=UPI002B0572DC|nr:hypothetical protein [Allobaculum sp. JKK-2023]